MADIENKQGVTADTKFRIGSITKQFTAVAILLLQEDGKLSVHDNISKYFPDYPLGASITIHHLLTHTSGIHSHTKKTGFRPSVDKPANRDELIDSQRKMILP